jgi:hypothetical protein
MRKNVLKAIVFLLLWAAGSTTVRAQQGFGTNRPDASAVVDMTATNKGVLLPRVALTATTAAAPVSSPATNLVVFNTATAGDVTPGLYYWNGSAWIRLLAKGDATGTGWNLTGNAGTTPGTHFVGTTDARDLALATSGAGRLRVTAAGSVGVGATTPETSAALDVSSSTQGFLPTRMTSAQIAAIANPVEGLLVYNTTQQCMMYYTKGAFTCTYITPAPPPVASNVTVSGANVLMGSSLTATYSYSQSTGVAAGTPAYQWYYATSGAGAGQTALSSTGATYTVAAPVVVGNYVAVSVTPVTTTGTAGVQVLSPWRQVVNNTPPAFGGVTNSAPLLFVGFAGTAGTSSYTDAESDPAGTPTYQWYRYNDAAGNGKTAITGATAASYTFTSADVGKYIKAGVTATATTGVTPGTELLASSFIGPIAAWSCGNSFTIAHAAGAVAPVSKTVTYRTVWYASRCWIGQNLGAATYASSVYDGTEANLGWYWRFNMPRGYYGYDNGSSSYPTWEAATPSYTGDWQPENDPCTLLLGASWQLPSYTDLSNAISGCANMPAAYATALKLHGSGKYVDGKMEEKWGWRYWTHSRTTGGPNCDQTIYGNESYWGNTTMSKSYGLTVRCVLK